MTSQCLSGPRIGDLAKLRAEVAAWPAEVSVRQREVD